MKNSAGTCLGLDVGSPVCKDVLLAERRSPGARGAALPARKGALSK